MKRLMLAALVMVCPSCATAPKAVEPITTAGIECLAAARDRTDVEACVLRVAMEAHQAVCVNAAPMLAVGASRAIQAAIDALRGYFR